MTGTSSEVVTAIKEAKAEKIASIRKKQSLTHKIMEIIFVIIGAFIMGVGLEYIVIPNGLLDGGITGISIMLSKLFGISVGTFLVILNAPFIFVAYKKMGKKYALNTLIGIIVLSVTTTVLHHKHVEPIVTDSISTIILGGVVLGIGVGIVFKANGALDGTEIFTHLIVDKVPFTMGNIIIVINLIIFSIATMLYTLEQALYSLVTYFIATKVIDMIQDGLSTTKQVQIISDFHEEITEAIQVELKRAVTHLKGQGGYSKEDKLIVMTIITRLEEQRLIDLVKEIDDTAMVIIADVADVKGGQFKKHIAH